MDIREVLNIRFRPADVVVLGDRGIGNTVQRKLKYIKQDLIRIQERHPGYTLPNEHRLKEAYMLFKENAAEGLDRLLEVFHSIAMVRRLAWSLLLRPDGSTAIVDDLHGLSLAQDLIFRRWRDSMLPALVHTLLHIWDRHVAAGRLRNLIKQILSSQGSTTRRVREFAGRQTYFLEADGPLRAAGELVSKEMTLTQGLSLLKLPVNSKYSPYYADVGAAFCQKAMRSQTYEWYIETILDFLREGASDCPSTFAKKCLVPILLRLSDTPETMLRERVQRAAFELIGDPSRESLWRPWSGASDPEKHDLERARLVLNGWIIQRFISAFFAKIAMDDDRRTFWSAYARHITRFKVFANFESQRRLKLDSMVQPYLEGRLGTMITTGQNALLMQIGDRTIVEFSFSGAACYVYRSESTVAPDFNRSRYSESDLKQPQMGLLYRTVGGLIYNLQPAGRVIHWEGWENRLSKWLKQELNISPNGVVS